MSKESIVFFRFDDIRRPAVKVTESASGDVTINIREGHDEHISLHVNEDPDYPLVFTHHAPEIAFSTHDEARIEAAKAIGYKDPERHADYTIHQHLSRDMLENPIEEGGGIFLIGRLLTVSKASPRAKYDKYENQIEIEVPSDTCRVDFILATEKVPFTNDEAVSIATQIGTVFIVPREESDDHQ